MSEAYETIITRILVETSDAIKNAAEIRGNLDVLKKEMLELSSVGKQSLKDIAAGMIEAKKAAQELEAVAKKTSKEGMFDEEDKGFAKQQREELAKYKADVKQALGEALKEESNYFKAGEKLAKQAGKTRGEEARKAAQTETKAIKAAQAEYVKVTKQGFGVMSAAAQAYGQRVKKIKDIIRDTAQSSGKSWNDVAQRMKRLGVPIKDINQALKELNSQTKKTTQSTKIFGMEIGKLGKVGQFVFGSILGLGAVQILRSIIGKFKEAAQEVIGFSQELFKLGASTRALQRSGLDITIADVSEKITELREEFGVFSRRDIASGLAQIQLYTRQLGFTVEQMDQMIDSVSTLSIVMGKDFGETARSVALFLSSGYGEALQRAGIVDANRATVATELLALGFKKSFNEATQQERALAGLSILLRGTADLTEETAGFQDTLAGKVRVLDAAWQDLLLTLGQELPISSAIEQLSRIVESITEITQTIKIGWAIVFLPFIVQITTALFLSNKLLELLERLTGREFNISIDFAIPEFMKKGEDDLKARMKDLGKDIMKSFKEGMEEEIDFTGIMEEIADEMEEEGAHLQNRLDKIGRDVANDLDRIGRNAANSITDIWNDYSQKITDILRKLEQRIADAIRRAALQREQVLRQANLRRDDINRKYRERELKSERDFQEAMRRLREDFLLDLEDALRERDALQVLRLTKRYNLEQDRLRREREGEKGDLDRQRRQELEDLERQTQERLRVIQEGLQAKLDALGIAADREREQAFIDAQRRVEEERIAEQRRKDEREIRAREQAKEEEKRSQERLEAYALELADREGLTEEAVNALILLLSDTYGEGGLVQGVIGGLEQVLIAANEAVAESARAMALEIMRAIAQIRALNNMSVSTPSAPPPSGPGYAEGGTLIANRPTTVKFGEDGLEMAQFTPLDRIGRDEGKIFGNAIPSLGGSGRGSGKLALEILLSHGLEARIVETALDEVADVIVNVQRKR